MAEVIKENDLNRIVVAACTPRTHEPLFQETLVSGRPEQIPLRNGQHPQSGLLGA
jgi:heterodisulfide reductase subunit A-like polyferredoxin